MHHCYLHRLRVCVCVCVYVEDGASLWLPIRIPAIPILPAAETMRASPIPSTDDTKEEKRQKTINSGRESHSEERNTEIWPELEKGRRDETIQQTESEVEEMKPDLM